MDWKSVISTVAPWIGTTLGGPLGGLAITAVAEALGLSDKTEDAIKAAITGATPEHLLAGLLAGLRRREKLIALFHGRAKGRALRVAFRGVCVERGREGGRGGVDGRWSAPAVYLSSVAAEPLRPEVRGRSYR